MAKAMIVTVGVQGEQIIFSLDKLKPEYLGLIYTNTKDSKKTLDTIMKNFPFPASKFKAIDVKDNAEEIGNVVTKFDELYNWLKKEGVNDKEIIVDPTGGRKWMSAGVAMIASFLGLDMVYVDAESKEGKPDPKTMKVVPMGNAYEKTGFIEEEKIDTLFNSCEYSVSYKLYDRLAQKVKVPRLYEIKKYISQSYLYWSQFLFSEAYESLETAISKCRKFDYMSDYINLLKKQVQILKILKKDDSLYALLKDPPFWKSALLNLWTFVEYESENEKYNTAVLGLYRILELISQIRLANHGINTDNIEKNIKEKHNTKFNAVARQIFQTEHGIASKIGLLDSWILLYCINDEFVQSQKDIKFLKNMQGATKPRNLLWVEHGSKKVSKNDYEQFKNYVKRWLCKIIPDYEQKIKPYRFIKF